MKTRLLLLLLFAFLVGNAQVTDGLIQEFKFDNSTTNEANTISFTYGGTGGLVSDRNGVANKALGFTNSGATATIPNLPYGSSQRSISFWAKSSYIGPIYHYFFVYGSNACEAGYGLGLNTSNIINLGVCSNASHPVTTVTDQWYYYTVTYDGTNMKIYVNANLVKTQAIALNTVNNSDLFTLGKDLFNGNPYAVNTFMGAIDDLKIYNRAITASEVTQLYGAGSSIAEYNFNNTYNNSVGNTPFANYPATTSFVADRNANASSALQILGGGSGTFSNAVAPTGNSPRSISLWYKVSANSGYPGIFSYGAAVQNQTFGLYLGLNGNPVFQGYVNDKVFGGNYPANVWRHIVVVYDGASISMYINGVLLGSQSHSLNTTVSTNFKLGSNVTTTLIDDLKIYDRALSQADITSLYTNNITLSSSDFNQKNLEVSLYPNPIRDVLNIESATGLKSIEIYNLQGQKVQVSNQKQTNVSDLASGIYTVRIQDEENGIATKKIIKQ